MSSTQRAALANTHSPSWETAFSKYLDDLQCPLGFRGEMGDALRWLLVHAVGLAYGDNAKQYNHAAAALAAAAPASGSGPDIGKPFTDWLSPEAVLKLRELQAVLHVDATAGSVLQQLQAVRSMLAGGVLPMVLERQRMAAAQQEAGGSGNGGDGSGGGGAGDGSGSMGGGHGRGDGGGGSGCLAGDGSIDLRRLPLGLDTGDPDVNRASMLLRLLYIKDLREVQEEIDSAIVQVQALTASVQAVSIKP